MNFAIGSKPAGAEYRKRLPDLIDVLKAYKFSVSTDVLVKVVARAKGGEGVSHTGE